MSKGSPRVRHAEVERETRHTKVYVNLGFDGGSKQDVNTGIGFFDHMLEEFGYYGRINLGINCEGNLAIDDHHTVCDVGSALGIALRKALQGDSVVGLGSAHAVAGEALVLVAVEMDGRGSLVWGVDFQRELLGSMATESVREFFSCFAHYCGATIHIHRMAGKNDHLLAEASFKGLGQALMAAARTVDRPARSRNI